MAMNPFDIKKMLSAGKIREQVWQSVQKLKESLGNTEVDLGYAYEICSVWQRRIELALRNEIPDWTGLAVFRSLTDFIIEKELWNRLFPDSLRSNIGSVRSDVEQKNFFNSPEKVSWGKHIYFNEGKPIHSGKFNLYGDAEDLLLKNIGVLTPQLGGQAGNILWLWNSIGANCVGYTPYIFKQLIELASARPELQNLQYFRFENGYNELKFLKDYAGTAGVRKTIGAREPAPSGGGVLFSEEGKRLICGFNGVSVLESGIKSRPWDRVQLH
jgi:hypothetical protein